MDNDSTKVLMAAMSRKNLGVGIVLTLLFGGLGMMYATMLGGIIFFILDILLLIVTIFTLGFGAVLYIPLHLIAAIVTVVAINSFNKKVMAGAAK